MSQRNPRIYPDCAFLFSKHKKPGKDPHAIKNKNEGVYVKVTTVPGAKIKTADWFHIPKRERQGRLPQPVPKSTTEQKRKEAPTTVTNTRTAPKTVTTGTQTTRESGTQTTHTVGTQTSARPRSKRYSYRIQTDKIRSSKSSVQTIPSSRGIDPALAWEQFKLTPDYIEWAAGSVNKK